MRRRLETLAVMAASYALGWLLADGWRACTITEAILRLVPRYDQRRALLSEWWEYTGREGHPPAVIRHCVLTSHPVAVAALLGCVFGWVGHSDLGGAP